MRIDSMVWAFKKRICISIDDDLFLAYCRFCKKDPDITKNFLARKLKYGEFKNSQDVKLFIYSQMMKPSAFKCFSGCVPEQVDLEDVV